VPLSVIVLMADDTVGAAGSVGVAAVVTTPVDPVVPLAVTQIALVPFG
jgi:hypothetical protein